MKTKELTESQKALRLLGGAMLAGLVSVPIYATQAGEWTSFFIMISVGWLVAGASALVGGTLGFLFGIPRTLQQEGNSPGPGLAESEPGAPSRRTDYRANTNLEQISDWLTKILVGVGLTQIGEIKTGLGTLSAFTAQGLGTQSHNQVFALGLICYSCILGFLFGYLWTRLFLAGALRVADQAVIGVLTEKVLQVTEKAATTERKLDEFKKQSDLDAAALNLSYRQLNPSPDLPEITQEALDMAIAAASRPIKVQVFNQAWQVRSDNWRDAKTNTKMAQTIPIFEALIRNDVENRFHKNHGQLGFALKDKEPPDWAGAERELTKAIEIRDASDEGGWLFYEMNRAICTIMLDPEFEKDQPSDADRKARILADLKAAFQAEELRKLIRADAAIKKWMLINHVKDLR
ncbi:MAG TPA: hypothetical protein VJT13_11190 [Xanthobacteraceae bacterium]|nr:hypothetical protein [Xanthobacteraceae bacterium]